MVKRVARMAEFLMPATGRPFFVYLTKDWPEAHKNRERCCSFTEQRITLHAYCVIRVIRPVIRCK